MARNRKQAKVTDEGPVLRIDMRFHRSLDPALFDRLCEARPRMGALAIHYMMSGYRVLEGGRLPGLGGAASSTDPSAPPAPEAFDSLVTESFE